MILQFEQNIEDVVALKEYSESQTRFNIKTRSRVFLVMVVIAVIAIGVLIYLDPSKAKPENLILGIALIAFYAIFYSPKVYRYRIKSSFTKDDIIKYSLERIYVFGEYGIDIKVGDEESFIDWEDIIDMRETKTHIFLFYSKKNAFIIPKRILLLSQEEQDLKSFIERKLVQPNH